MELRVVPALTGAEVEDRINALVQNAVESAGFFWEVKANWQKHSPDCPDWKTFCDTVLIPRFEESHIKSYSLQRIDQMVNWYEVKHSLPADLTDRVTNEAQGRELARVPADRREEVLREALRTAPKHPKFAGATQNSAAHIKATAERMAAPVEAPPAVVDVQRDFFSDPVHPVVAIQPPSPNLSAVPPLPATADTLPIEKDLEYEEGDDFPKMRQPAVDLPDLAVNFDAAIEGSNGGFLNITYDPHQDRMIFVIRHLNSMITRGVCWQRLSELHGDGH